jgi:hypothetical protein
VVRAGGWISKHKLGLSAKVVSTRLDQQQLVDVDVLLRGHGLDYTCFEKHEESKKERKRKKKSTITNADSGGGCEDGDEEQQVGCKWWATGTRWR